MQLILVAFDQSPLLRATPAFELSFTMDGIQFGRKGFLVEDCKWRIGGCMSGACSAAMTFKSGREVVSVAYVEAAVVACKEVDIPLHRKKPFDVLTLFFCSGHSTHSLHAPVACHEQVSAANASNGGGGGI